MDGKSISENIKTAQRLLCDYKGSTYTFGLDCLDATVEYIREFGNETLLIISGSSWAKPLRKKVDDLLRRNNIKVVGIADTAAPNNPLEDVLGLARIITSLNPSSITCMGGGSAIDCAKAANAFACTGENPGDMEKFFGTGNVSKIARQKNKKLYPLIAVELLAGSASHLTRYSNITFPEINQKKLIVDDILIPDRAVFDYSNTVSAPLEITLDGAMDGLSHSLEAYYGASEEKIGKAQFELLEEICLTSISMIVQALPQLTIELKNRHYREIIGLATDLGGYSIMFGGTSGAHLNSYSLVDILSHGRACAVLNPYYTVFFSTSISDKLIKLANIFKSYLPEGKDFRDLTDGRFQPRQIGEYVASAMISFSKRLGFPSKLSQIEGFSEKHHKKILEAAKNPQLDMKLKNMPVPLDAGLVDEYMGPILLAAFSGDFSRIKNIDQD